MGVAEIRRTHWLRDTSDAVDEALCAIQQTQSEWANWRIIPAYPLEETGDQERQLLVWSWYRRITELSRCQGGMVASKAGTVYRGFQAVVEFEIGARASPASGWWHELLEVESALTTLLVTPFGPPASLVELGMSNFAIEPESEQSPTLERPITERAWVYRFTVPVVEEVGS